MAKKRASASFCSSVCPLAIFLVCVTALPIGEGTFPCHLRGEATFPRDKQTSLKTALVRNGSDCVFSQEPHLRNESAKGSNESKHHHEKHHTSLPKCACQCRMSDRAKTGSYSSRPCLQWKFLHSLFHTMISRSWTVPTTHPRNAKSSRRCRKLQSACWTADSTPNAKGQAERNRLRKPVLPGHLTGRTLNNSRGWKGSRCALDLMLLMSESQRNEGRGRGKGSVVWSVLVSLVPVYVLLQGVHTEQRTGRGLKERLLCLLRGPAFDRRTVRWDEATETCSPHGFLLDQTSVRLCEPSWPSDKTYHNHDSDSDNVLSWCFRPRFAPFTRLWVSPATFLPRGVSHTTAYLDHVGCRLATLAALPSSCTLSRVRLAEAGFHYNPTANSSAVLCHQCGVAYNLQQESGAPTPLAFHQAASSRCSVVRSALEKNGEPASLPAVSSVPGTVPAPTAQQESFPGPSSASLPVGAGLSALESGLSKNAGGGDRRDLSEDSEGTASDTTTDAAGHRGIIQRTQSTLPSTGYVLALAGSSMDQTVESQNLQRDHPEAPSSRHQPSNQATPAGSGNWTSRAEENGQLLLDQAVYPQFSTLASRLATFRSWPATMEASFPAKMMVDLGFYFADYADCVRCFYCGVGLKSWDAQDDAMTEHLRWRPNCGYLLATRGRPCVERVLASINEGNGTQDDTRGTSDIPPMGRESHSFESEAEPPLVQQLITMGFAARDISTARTNLRRAGKPENLEHMLEVLF